MVTLEQLEKISTYILDGMSEKEACTLTGVSWVDLEEKKETDDLAKKLIEKKHIQFKYNHLKEIQKTKSERNSMWMLEKLRPDEFSGRGKGGDGTTVNIISAIINEIQNEDQGIVRNTRYTREVESVESSKLGVSGLLG